jgi:drug/metabolite transporter (DMT)-like permease
VVWAVYALLQKKLMQDFHALELIFIIVTVGALLFLPFSTPSDITKLDTVQQWMLAFGMLNTALAYGCFTEAMRHWDASRVSAVVAIVPVLTLAIGYFQHQLFPNFLPPESFNNLSIFGAIIVVTGSSITALSKKSTKTDIAYIDYD